MSALDTNTLLSDALKGVQQARLRLKTLVFPNMLTALGTPTNVNADVVLRFVNDVKNALAVMAAAVGSVNATALAAYAQAQVNQPTYDPVADYNSLVTALNNILSAISGTGGYNLSGAYSWGTNSTVVQVSVTPAQATSLTTLINTAATILA